MTNFVVDTLNLVDATVKPYTITAWSNVAAANATALRLMLILYVALFGVFVWYGALQLTMGQIVRHLFTAIAVFVLATSWGAFATLLYDVFTHGPDALAGALAGGGAGASDALGRVFDQGIEAARVVWQQAGPMDLTLALVGAIVFIGTVLMTGAALVLVVLAKLALAVLLALGPVFIMLYLFSATRGFFEGWIRQLANFSMLIVLTFGVLALILKIIEPATAMFAVKGASIQLLDTAQFLLLAVVAGFLFALVPGFSAGVVGGFALHASSALAAAAGPIRAARQEARALAGDWLNRTAGLRIWPRSVTYRSGAALNRGARSLYSRLRRR
jgi:type IV secretion system protein VirB6